MAARPRPTHFGGAPPCITPIVPNHTEHSMRVLRSALVALALIPALAARQGPAKRPLAIEDYYRIKTIGGVTISPDGKWVAFNVSTRLEDTNGNFAEAWVVPW